MNTLSERQEKILKYIMSVDNDIPPTIREIGEAVQISSTSVVNYNLTKLEELDLVTRRKEVSRGLRPNWDRLRELGMADTFDTAQVNGNGESHRNGSADQSSEQSFVFKVPILGQIAAGTPINVETVDPKSADDWIELPNEKFSHYGDLFGLRVKGNSMIDASVLNGDIVVLKHQETAEDGDMVAAWIEGDEETTLKYFYQEGPKVRLQPANPEFEPIIRDADKVRINGKVVSVQRNL